MSNLAELVFVPAPGMGHLVSMLQLSKLLLQSNESISISIHIIDLPIFSDKLNAYIESQTRDNPYPTRLTFVTFPPLTTPIDPSLPGFFITVIELHKPLFKEMINNRVRNNKLPKPAGFVLDMFCSTMVDIANELLVPSYVFFTSGASLLNFIFYAESLANDHGLQAPDLATKISDPDFSLPITGFKNPVMSKFIPAVFKEEFGSEMILNFAKNFRKMKGILVNSYVELESFGIQSLQDSDDKKIPPVYPVGPILDLKSGGRENESIIQWLDCQPNSSVVFLCFGSMGSFNEEQVKEIANGLDQCGHRFLWALRKPPMGGKPGSNETFLEALPDGFVEHTANRGKIIGWAPQVEVLAHPAIGGFVSHCGWNSTLESLWFNVPIGTWPMYAEQQLNAFELVKELDLAVEIRMDFSMDFVSGKAKFLVKAMEIEEGVKKLMSMDEKMIGNVIKMSDESRKALEEGGSSNHWLGCFIEDVLSHVA